MNNIEYTNKMINKYNGITKKEYDKLSYGQHFQYAKTTFTKKGVSCTIYVPHQNRNDFDDSAFDSTIYVANMNKHALQFDPDNTFRIGDNIQGGI